MSKSNENTPGVSTEAPAKSTKKKGASSTKSVIMGIGMALVFVSITWSTAIVGLGTDWAKTSVVMLAPQALFGVTILGYAFSKMFK